MKSVLFLLLITISTMAQAQRINETVDESRQRQQAEQFKQYQDRGNQQPLGGYNQKFGDSVPRPLYNDAYTQTTETASQRKQNRNRKRNSLMNSETVSALLSAVGCQLSRQLIS